MRVLVILTVFQAFFAHYIHAQTPETKGLEQRTAGFISPTTTNPLVNWVLHETSRVSMIYTAIMDMDELKSVSDSKFTISHLDRPDTPIALTVVFFVPTDFDSNFIFPRPVYFSFNKKIESGLWSKHETRLSFQCKSHSAISRPFAVVFVRHRTKFYDLLCDGSGEAKWVGSNDAQNDQIGRR